MKRFSLILLLFLASGNLLGQSIWDSFFGEEEVPRVLVDDVVNKGTRKNPILYHESEKFSGEVFDIYTNGKLKFEKSYVDGLRNGPSIIFNSDGNILYDELYESNKMIKSKRFDYFDNGNLYFEENVIENEVRHGPYVVYFKSGLIRLKQLYERGMLNGIAVQYNAKGIILSSGNYNYGLKDGPWVYKYDNGQTKRKGSYKNGIEEGFWVEYYENGEKKSEGTYYRGYKDGDWKFYNEYGSLTSEGEFYNGDQEGPWFYYDEYLYNATEFQEGYKHGIEVYYNEFERPITEIEYAYGEKHGYAHYYEYEYIESPGYLIVEGSYFEDKEHGIWKELYESGNVKVRSIYENGLQTGEYAHLSEEGVILEIGLMKEGLKSGVWSSRDSTGHELYRIEFKKGIKNGNGYFYDEKGREKKIVNYIDGEVGNLICETEYYETDTISKETCFSKDTFNRWERTETFYQNGKLKSEEILCNNQRSNTWKYYYASGELGAKISWINNSVVEKVCYSEKTGKQIKCRKSTISDLFPEDHPSDLLPKKY